MQFETTTKLSVESMPRETLYKITNGENYWVLTLQEAIALWGALKRAVDYETE